MKRLSALGIYLSNKKNFLVYSLLTIGVPGAVAAVWLLNEYGGPLYWLILVGAAFLGAYIWGLLMWHFFAKGFWGIQEKPTTKN